MYFVIFSPLYDIVCKQSFSQWRNVKYIKCPDITFVKLESKGMVYIDGISGFRINDHRILAHQGADLYTANPFV